MRKNSTDPRLRIALVAVAGALLAIAGGCAATDPSPSMTALGRSDAEIAKTYTIASDENIRQILDDLERAFYTDRPSRLSPMAIPH